MGIYIWEFTLAIGDEIILRFLDIGVVNVGGDDTKLQKLSSAVQELSDLLKKTPVMTTSYTMVAADPNIEATDLTIQDGMAVLKKNWTTVNNTFSGPPVAIIRAMLLDAVVQAARQDDAIATAFVNVARNALTNVELGDEATIWRDVVAEIEAKVDVRAEAEWATPDMITVKALVYKKPGSIVVSSSDSEVNRAALQVSIQSSVGQQNQTGHNPHWVHQNPQQWGSEFASRLSVTIADAIDTAIANSGVEPIDLGAPLAGLAKAVTDHVDSALAAFSGATAGLQRRTNLLWWKEALYSTSAQKSYRDLPIYEAAAMMALDLHEQVPMYSPASVSAFLQEAIRLLPLEQEHSAATAYALVKNTMTSQVMEPLRALAGQLVADANRRGPILCLLADASAIASLDTLHFQRLSGLNDAMTFSPAAWGGWLFRELQAARATGTSGPGHSRRKG